MLNKEFEEFGNDLFSCKGSSNTLVIWVLPNRWHDNNIMLLVTIC